MVYFGSIKTMDELKIEYRRLVLANHPDKGGDPAIMRKIIETYKEIMEKGLNVIYQAYEEITAEDVDEYFDDVAEMMDYEEECY